MRISTQCLFCGCLLIAVSGCFSLIPGYEVLSVPRGGGQYHAGKQWIQEIGPSGKPLAPTTRESGVKSIEVSNNRDAGSTLKMTVTEWITGTLGLKNDDVEQLDLKNTTLEYVTDAYTIKAAADVLWETITADGVTFTLKKGFRGSVDAATVGNKLTKSINGSAGLKASLEQNGSYVVTSDTPLVIAIRVVRTSYDSAASLANLDLSSKAINTWQPAGLGYTVSLEEPVEPIHHIAKLRISNNGLPQFQSVSVSFNDQMPEWINSNRTAIAKVDPKAKNGVFVWDKIAIQWERQLSQCHLEVVRQYLTIKPVKSNLPNTR